MKQILTGVATGVGVTVLMEGQAKPRSPSDPPDTKEAESDLASSILCPGIVTEPIVTLSV